jgi:hypothetical protein
MSEILGRNEMTVLYFVVLVLCSCTEKVRKPLGLLHEVVNSFSYCTDPKLGRAQARNGQSLNGRTLT